MLLTLTNNAAIGSLLKPFMQMNNILRIVKLLSNKVVTSYVCQEFYREQEDGLSLRSGKEGHHSRCPIDTVPPTAHVTKLYRWGLLRSRFSGYLPADAAQSIRRTFVRRQKARASHM